MTLTMTLTVTLNFSYGEFSDVETPYFFGNTISEVLARACTIVARPYADLQSFVIVGTQWKA